MMRRTAFYDAWRLIVGLAAVALIIHTWLVMGLIVPVTVSGNSMAPTFHGPHRLLRCEVCEIEFPVGFDQLPAKSTVYCPRCERWSSHVTVVADRHGDRILVDRTAFTFRPPRRWEVVVFRSPENAGQLCVKRIVGLPGETVSLVDGDVWINGQLLRPPIDREYRIRPGDRPRKILTADGAKKTIWEGWRLGPTEFFVIGDNTAISVDSRNWTAGPGLDAKLIVGRPLGVR